MIRLILRWGIIIWVGVVLLSWGRWRVCIFVRRWIISCSLLMRIRLLCLILRQMIVIWMVGIRVKVRVRVRVRVRVSTRMQVQVQVQVGIMIMTMTMALPLPLIVIVMLMRKNKGFHKIAAKYFGRQGSELQSPQLPFPEMEDLSPTYLRVKGWGSLTLLESEH